MKKKFYNLRACSFLLDLDVAYIANRMDPDQTALIGQDKQKV